MSFEVLHAVDRRQRRLDLGGELLRRDEAEVVRRQRGEQAHADVGWRRAVGDDQLRNVLDVVGRQPVIGRTDEGLEVPPRLSREKTEEAAGILLAHVTSVPVVNTFHGRIDFPFAARLFSSPPRGLVAISRAQAHLCPDVAWEAVVHNGLNLSDAPFERRAGEDLCFVGRVAPEKGIVDAMEVANLAGRKLRIAAKIGPRPDEKAYYENVFVPALKAAGTSVEFLGEIGPRDRDRLFAESAASLMPGSWPEPFGLVAIESLACGTPIVARRAGALPEIIRDGVDGFLADDPQAMAFSLKRIGQLDRAQPTLGLAASAVPWPEAGRTVEGGRPTLRSAVSASLGEGAGALAGAGAKVSSPTVEAETVEAGTSRRPD